MMRWLLVLALLQPRDPRMCGVVPRDTTGRIVRDMRPVREFRQLYPCPATKLHTGACPGWAVDHVIPLACGGCDSLANLQWLPDSTKSARGRFPKDRWERRVYCARGAK